MSRRYTLSQNDLKMIENKLFMYKRIDNAIAVRKQELKIKENRDENFGGGHSNKISKPVEELVMKWDADPQNHLEVPCGRSRARPRNCRRLCTGSLSSLSTTSRSSLCWRMRSC